MIWFKTDEGSRARKNSDNKINSNGYNHNKNKKHGGGVDGNWNNKFNKAINYPQSLNSVMYVLVEEDKINISLVAAIKAYAALTSNDYDADTDGSIATDIPAANLTENHP